MSVIAYDTFLSIFNIFIGIINLQIQDNSLDTIYFRVFTGLDNLGLFLNSRIIR